MFCGVLRLTRWAECHTQEPHYSRGMCRLCYERDLRRRNPGFASRQRKNRDKWGKKHPRRVKALNRASSRKSRLRLYGLDGAAYEAMNTAQGGLCKICRNKCPRHANLSVDHCHKTGEVRGLLCRDCNYGLGVFKDEPERLRRAALYLEKKLNG